MENYQEEGPQSNAYRIKEMGDGFLCSVGYPFRSNTVKMVEDALELAFRFTEAFHEHAKRLNMQDPPHCSIGIAMGSISGLFPSGGVRQYDLYGRSIILATRYESMRKTLMKGAQPASLIILHERVYENLGDLQKKDFKEYNLTEHRIVVRDDPEAKSLFYCVVTDIKDYNVTLGKDENGLLAG